ncbi:histidinol-phosphate transaminase [Vibrio sagamiensis]|uniref:histidinol-phosphate transaminase n=1 Tax=Vibrio sagamiensis NBRC 104589 TaxID=1219064 RepID=A0A511QG35_9VIBR|nr:histidinol-phosphate transaminase [Vibrio sagamiensis]PNQ55066.1 histidinol-phosphate transaminase [Vibrio agarivorans]GEM76241.1 histidinol-phosphate aminotransferase 2 [Vibrio sagamiensis NBRC 104589]
MSNINKFISEGFSKLQPYKAGLTTQAIQAKYGIDDVYKFASNESPFPPSDLAVKAIIDAISNTNRYPDYCSLKTSIAQLYQLGADNVLLGSGSINVLDLLFQAFSNQGSNVVFTSCSYFAYPLLAQKSGLKVKLAQADEQLRHIARNLVEQCDEYTSLLVIDNPGNFSGGALSAAEIESILTEVSKDTIVILDQAYEEFTDESRFVIDSETFKRFPNLVITRTFSKAYSLAALRVGYALANKELIGWLNSGQQPFPVSNLGIAAAIASLQDKTYSQEVIKSIKRGRAVLFEGLSALGLKCYPSNSNFVLVEFGDKASEIYSQLLEQGFITRQMQVYQRPDLIRISVGSDEENHRLLHKIEVVMNG